MAAKKTDTGKQGEQLAAAYLQGQGYQIVARNWRCKYGEVDLIARKDAVLVFVEVRTRHAATTEAAFASIQQQKQAKMRAAALAYLHNNDLQEQAWRIDVMGIALRHNGTAQIDHVEDALDWS